MANHTAVKVGGWVFRDPIEHDQITGIQERLLKCPNFDEGSTHAPSGNIILTDGGTVARNFAMRTSGELGSLDSHVWTLGGILAAFGSGARIRLNTSNFSMSADASYSIKQLGQLVAVTSLGGANRDLTLTDEYAGVGDFILFINRDLSGNTLSIVDDDSGELAEIGTAGIGLAIYMGSAWIIGRG